MTITIINITTINIKSWGHNIMPNGIITLNHYRFPHDHPQWSALLSRGTRWFAAAASGEYLWDAPGDENWGDVSADTWRLV